MLPPLPERNAGCGGSPSFCGVTPPFLSQKTYNKPTSDLLNKIKQNYHQKQAIIQCGLFQKYLQTATATQSATGLDLESCGWQRRSNLNVLFGRVG